MIPIREVMEKKKGMDTSWDQVAECLVLEKREKSGALMIRAAKLPMDASTARTKAQPRSLELIEGPSSSESSAILPFDLTKAQIKKPKAAKGTRAAFTVNK